MYSILDIETTGNHAHRHSITEIAIINFDGEKITDQFSTLIKPEMEVPRFISHFTGITNEMVMNAPLWEEVMEAIDAFTHQRIIVAHNAHFDYSFIKSAFLQSGKSFSRKTLCTLRLSRQLFPGLASYSLDQLCRHLKIDAHPSHRAESDAQAALQLFNLLRERDHHGIIEASLKKKSNDYNLPPHLSKEIIQSLPDAAGVYYFLDQSEKILYVGKAKSIKSRVLQHFTSNSSTRSRTRLMNSIHNIRFENCGNELIAMLKESAEIKKYFPPFNVIQKISETNFGLYSYEDGKGYLRFAFKKLQRGDQPLVSFPGLQEGRMFLQEKQKEFHLCPKLCGLQRAKQECFDHATGLCDGACIGEISLKKYNARVNKCIEAMKADSVSCAILGAGRDAEEESVVILENGKYFGFGFKKKGGEDSFEVLKECITHQKDNREVQWIIRSYLQTRNDFRAVFAE